MARLHFSESVEIAVDFAVRLQRGEIPELAAPHWAHFRFFSDVIPSSIKRGPIIRPHGSQGERSRSLERNVDFYVRARQVATLCMKGVQVLDGPLDSYTNWAVTGLMYYRRFYLDDKPREGLAYSVPNPQYVTLGL